MRFESVKAYAFGPFRNETLEVAPGMNVVYGPNEVGKSSWHAALYAGLCGMRRGRGRAKDNEGFAQRHRPWNGDTSWEVGAIIRLADGRRIELRHDLAGRVNSSARDVDLAGHDYSNEIMFENTPDGAQWLGLNRHSFVMTACIRQTDILGLLRSPSALQGALQRAADTADHDGTAAEALGRLQEFRAESVGSGRATTKPLKVTEGQVRRAKRELERAQEGHEKYLTRWMEVDKLSQRARDAERRLDVARAARGAAAASEAAERLERAQELYAHFPDGEPMRPSQNNDLVQRIASTVTTWNQRPSVREPEGESIPVLEERLAEVNLHLAVNAERAAIEVENRLERARELNARFPQGRPSRPSEGDQIERRVARALAAWEARPEVQVPVGATVSELKQDLADVWVQLGEGTGAKGGLVSMLFRALRAFFSVLLRPLRGGQNRQALEERRALIQERIAVREDADRQCEENRRLVREAAVGIQEAATAAGISASSPDEAVASLQEWQEHRSERMELQQVLRGDTLDALDERAMAARREAESAATCTDASALATALAEPAPAVSEEIISQQRRMTLVHAIEERRRQEREHSEAIASVRAAERAVAETARLVGIKADSPHDQVAGLLAWQTNYDDELKKADEEIEDWGQLKSVLGQDSIEELAVDVARLRRRADELSAKVGVGDTDDLPTCPTEAEFATVESEAEESRIAFERAQTELQVFARELLDVAEAKETLVVAEGEHARIQSLGHTLDLTISFLEKAEERVHRDVAPVLAKTVREWLPVVTDGRYTDCRVDPEELAVEVSTPEGRWQRAEFFSHGTAEQVYLLLRLALARHLAIEECPLILDDAVASCDSQRKRDLLETLLALSESTQVILFTHEDDVCEWARERLLGESHKLTELSGARPLT